MATEKKEKKEKRGRSENKVVTPLLRFSFPHIARPHTQGEYADEKYKVTGLIEKEREPELKPLKQECMNVAKQIWPNIKYSEIETPFKDGDEKTKADGETLLDGYEGHIFFVAKSPRKPGVVGPDRNPLPEGKEVYGGCYGKLSLLAYTYENTRKEVHVDAKGKKKEINVPVKGVAFGLQNVQFVKDGERFGGGSGDPTEDFEAVEDLELGSVDEDEAFDETPVKKNGGKPAAGKKGRAAVEADETEEEEGIF